MTIHTRRPTKPTITCSRDAGHLWRAAQKSSMKGGCLNHAGIRNQRVQVLTRRVLATNHRIKPRVPTIWVLRSFVHKAEGFPRARWLCHRALRRSWWAAESRPCELYGWSSQPNSGPSGLIRATGAHLSYHEGRTRVPYWKK